MPPCRVTRASQGASASVAAAGGGKHREAESVGLTGGNGRDLDDSGSDDDDETDDSDDDDALASVAASMRAELALERAEREREAGLGAPEISAPGRRAGLLSADVPWAGAGELDADAVTWRPRLTGLPAPASLPEERRVAAQRPPSWMGDQREGGGRPATGGRALMHPPRDMRKEARAVQRAAPSTAGAAWFDLPAPAMTPELRRDLRLIKLRGALDPKRFYKAPDSTKLPTHFHVGTVVEAASEFYSARLAKADRRTNLSEELAADKGLAALRRKRFAALQEKAQAGGRGQKMRKIQGGGGAFKHKKRKVKV